MTTTLTDPTLLDDDFYTPREISDILKFRTSRPILNAIGRGELRAADVSGHYRIAREDLLTFLSRSVVRPDELEPETVVKESARRGGRAATVAA